MTSRQLDTTTPAKAQLTPTRQQAVPGAEAARATYQQDRFTLAAPGSGGVPRAQAQAAALTQASGGRLARAGDALLALQRLHGNHHVQQVVHHALQNQAVQRLADGAAQRAAVGAQGGQIDASLQGAIQAALAGGRPLDPDLGAQMGRALGADLSHVKVHTDAKAEHLSRSLGAAAFTIGTDIFFDRNRYRPDTPAGKQMLAHELTHVVQQGGAKNAKVRVTSRVAPAGDRYEQEANRVAGQIVRRTPMQPQASDGDQQPVQRVATTHRSSAGRIQRVFKGLKGPGGATGGPGMQTPGTQTPGTQTGPGSLAGLLPIFRGYLASVFRQALVAVIGAWRRAACGG